MKEEIKTIAVTGGAGQIAYQLLFRLADSTLFGPNQKIALQILEVESKLKALEGVVMELDDSAFKFLDRIEIGSDPKKIFKDADYALLVGSKPRGPGMERGALLEENGRIFVEQGKALNEVAKRDVKVLVVGNPCNTNCLIAMQNAPDLKRKNFHAMTRLDQNRAASMIAKKANVPVSAVSNMTIWGNHSSTQVPDFINVKIFNESIQDYISDKDWFENDFVSAVQKRGAAIIALRGQSSAASATEAILNTIESLETVSEEGHSFSSAICSDGNGYGIQEGLIFSLPCLSKGKGDYEIVQHLPWNDYLKEKILLSEKELLEEREFVKNKF